MSQLQTGFLPGSRGNLHTSIFYPEREVPFSQWVLHVPAFGEEMNKSRAMVARQARALAKGGITVLVPDLYGTGDSEGCLEDVSWQGWREDIIRLAQWAREQGATQLTLWGHRMGCLLAADAARMLKESPDRLLFWQPVHSGKQHMGQFLRLRMVGGLVSGGSETVSQLRECLLAGESLEIAGYILSGSLFRDIEPLRLAEMVPPTGTGVQILEVVSAVDKPVLPVTLKLVDQWRHDGVDCCAQSVQGNPFWMTQELGFAPCLIEETSQLVSVLEAGGQRNGVTSLPSPEYNFPLQGLSVKSSLQSQALVFSCEGEQVSGVLDQPEGNSTLGVLIVVGGPQYRVGSHRQFVFLSRYLAEQGLPVLRFDYRGMGDSGGELRGFEHIQEDIRCAIDALQRHQPSVTGVVIWGLCDAATAAIEYAKNDKRVRGLILANPWVHSDQGAAKAYLKHYYIQRVLQGEFWRKVFSGNFQVSTSLVSAWSVVKGALRKHAVEESAVISKTETPDVAPTTDLVKSFTNSLAKFKGEVFFIFSGKDLTAAEFIDAAHSNKTLRRLMKRNNVSQRLLPESDHTFSRNEWRYEVEAASWEQLRRMQ